MESSIHKINNNGTRFFETIDWKSIPVTEHAGQMGVVRLKIIQNQRFRMRMIEYSKGYTANHGCAKGHIVFCLEGEMISELSDGRVLTLSEGMSYQVSDGLSSHRSHSKNGVKLLIIDGEFLKGKKPINRNPWRM